MVSANIACFAVPLTSDKKKLKTHCLKYENQYMKLLTMKNFTLLIVPQDATFSRP